MSYIVDYVALEDFFLGLVNCPLPYIDSCILTRMKPHKQAHMKSVPTELIFPQNMSWNSPPPGVFIYHILPDLIMLSATNTGCTPK